MIVGATVLALYFGTFPAGAPAASPGSWSLRPAVARLAGVTAPPAVGGPLSFGQSDVLGRSSRDTYRLVPGVTPPLVGVFGLVGFGLGHLMVNDTLWTLTFLGVDALLFGAGALIGALTGPALLPLGLAVWLVLHLPQAADAYLKASEGGGFLPSLPTTGTTPVLSFRFWANAALPPGAGRARANRVTWKPSAGHFAMICSRIAVSAASSPAAWASRR